MTVDPTGGCPERDRINGYCSCPKRDCPRHGLCCACVVAHKGRDDPDVLKRLPHCLRGLVGEALARK
ncbi:MAG: hypothetical protein Kow0092_09860 [Deferrisomatales bacterium]